MQRTRVAFYLYLVENGLNIVLALLLVGSLGVRGLALSLSIAYSVAALLALAVFHQWFGRLAERETWAPLVRVVIASVPMGVVVLVVSNLSASTSVAGLAARVVGSVVAGGLTFGAVVIWLGRRHDTHRRPPSRPVSPAGPDNPRGPVRPAGPRGATRRVASSRQAGVRSTETGGLLRNAAPAGVSAFPGPHRSSVADSCMPGVHIVTDSACDLTDQLVKEHNIIVVPLTIRFGDEELEDRRQLTPTEFWERCRGKGDLPSTAAPSPGAFQAAFQQAADEGADAVLCLTISSKVSGTYGSAVTAADTFTSVPVRVVDTYSLTMGQGLLVIAASEEAAAGAGMDELVAATEDRIPRTHIYGVLGGLEHLQRGGRVGGARALLGSLLNIKPVIQLRDGEVAEESKQRTRSKALAYLNDKVRADAPLERLAVADGACDDFADVLARLSDIVTEHPLVSVDLGPVVGTHAGPNTVGVCYIVPASAAGTAG